MNIYLIRNNITQKCYIGQTKRTIDHRLRVHFSEAKRHLYGMYLHNSIRKHGSEVFSIELLEECGMNEVSERERYWIRFLNTKEPYGYNEHDGGNGGCLNPSDELRQKLRKAKVGHVPWNKGKKNCQNYGPDFRKKISEAKKKWWDNKKEKERCLLTEDTPQTSE